MAKFEIRDPQFDIPRPGELDRQTHGDGAGVARAVPDADGNI